MSNDYTINVDDFTGKELDQVIAMLAALPAEDAPEVPTKFKNKAEQAELIQKFVSIHALKPKKATEADFAAIPTLAEEGVQEGEICLVALDYVEQVADVEDKGENAKKEQNSTPAAKSNEPDTTKNRFFMGEAVVNTQNRIINGKLYTEVRTVSATYTVTPEEYKNGVKKG